MKHVSYTNSLLKMPFKSALDDINKKSKSWIRSSTFNMLLHFGNPSPKEAWSLYNRMKKRQYRPNAITQNLLLQNFAKCRKSSEWLIPRIQSVVNDMAVVDIRLVNCLTKVLNMNSLQKESTRLIKILEGENPEGGRIDFSRLNLKGIQMDQVTFGNILIGLKCPVLIEKYKDKFDSRNRLLYEQFLKEKGSHSKEKLNC